ncbi:phosphoethanolamine transferase [Apibacter raozihei]|uniref:phosphoethanolamine transferase n=1 Tax=Apibacter raozihei TaxID=2500547 RepID=UPI000FE39816|nr:phosphoethanolamine transferase [Apibacter raozihei]
MIKVFKFFYNYKFTVVLIGFLTLLCFLYAKQGLYYAFLLSIPGVLSLVLLINWLAKIRYSLFFTLILSLIIALDAYFAIIFKNPVSLGGMASIFETNTQEAWGAMRQALVPGLLAIAGCIAIVLLSRKELKTSGISKKKSIIFLSIYLGVFVPFSLLMIINQTERLNLEYKENPVLTVQKVSSICLPVVYNDLITIVAYKNEMRRFKQFSSIDRKLPEKITFLNSENSPEKIFMVIGESSWRSRYSLYGNSVQTTPFLDSLSTAGHNLKYYNAVSPSPITREALKIILSFSTPFQSQSFFNQKNIIELAKDAGYETVWISNQAKIGMFDSYIGFIASGADDSYFTEVRGDNKTKDDLQLIDILKEKSTQGRKQFIVIHLMGSHMWYGDKSDEIDKSKINGEWGFELLYDRSIHHTDRVLREVFQIADKEKKYLMMYFPDHGERIGEGHGFLGRGSHQFEIPYITINREFEKINEIIPQYIDKEALLLNSSNTIYIMAEVLGYKIPEEFKSRAINDGKYIYHVDSKPYLYADIEKENEKIN